VNVVAERYWYHCSGVTARWTFWRLGTSARFININIAVHEDGDNDLYYNMFITNNKYQCLSTNKCSCNILMSDMYNSPSIYIW